MVSAGPPAAPMSNTRTVYLYSPNIVQPVLPTGIPSRVVLMVSADPTAAPMSNTRTVYLYSPKIVQPVLPTGIPSRVVLMVSADPTAAPMSNTRSHSFSLSLTLPPTLTHSHSPGSPGPVAQTTPTNAPSYGETNAIFSRDYASKFTLFLCHSLFVQHHNDLTDGRI